MSNEEKVIEENEGVEEEAAEVVDQAPAEEQPEEQPEPTIEEKLAAAEAKAAENLEGWQRAVAELSNARKRFEKQRIEARNNATADIANDILPVLDDFDLTIANVPEEIAASDWFGGFSLVPRKLASVLERLNIEKITSVGEPFDPSIHNAIMREESAEYESGTVIREYQPGYKLRDRIIRPAVVAVAE